MFQIPSFIVPLIPLLVFGFMAGSLFGIVYLAARLAIRHERRVISH